MVPPPALPPVVAEDPPQEAQEEVSPPAPPQAEAPLPEVPPPAEAEAEAEAHHHGVGHQAQAQARWSPVVAPPPEALLPGKLGVQLPGVSPPGPPLWADPPAVALRAVRPGALLEECLRQEPPPEGQSPLEGGGREGCRRRRRRSFRLRFRPPVARQSLGSSL